MMGDSESPLAAVDEATGDSSLFAGLDEASRRAVEAEVEWVRVAGGTTLFRQGDAGDSLYVVIRGRLQAIAEFPGRDPDQLGDISRGEIVGEMAVLTGDPRSATVRAVRDSALRSRLGVPTETLEGYLFPDTYVIALGTTARQAVALMATRFERVWRPEWTARLDSLHRTRHEIVTLASIVEMEVQRPEERPVVAAVYWNRLRINMALQADPTVLYALGKAATHVYYSDLNVKSPYNTYRRAGLPPGPIASPGKASMDATLHPAKVPYRYFVAAPDGHHEFRRTFAEHEAAILRLRAEARADSVRTSKGADSAGRASTAVTPSRGRGGA